jgi:hypothetical protein
MRALVETMIESKRWRSEESIAPTKLDHIEHRGICIPAVYSKVQVQEELKKKELPYDRGSVGTRLVSVPESVGPIPSL